MRLPCIHHIYGWETNRKLNLINWIQKASHRLYSNGKSSLVQNQFTFGWLRRLTRVYTICIHTIFPQTTNIDNKNRWWIQNDKMIRGAYILKLSYRSMTFFPLFSSLHFSSLGSLLVWFLIWFPFTVLHLGWIKLHSYYRFVVCRRWKSTKKGNEQ